MATKIWRGDAPAIKQVDHFTPGSVAAGRTFTVTMNGKSVSYTTSAGTVGDVCAGLASALSASGIAEFAELAWTEDGSKVIGTAATAGRPFAATSGATGGSTLTRTAVVASAGPHHWDAAENWSPTGVPSGGDDVVVTNDVDILYGLDQSAAGTLASLTWAQHASARLGLPERSGGGYVEYRETHLKINVSAINVGVGAHPEFGLGTGRFKINCLATQTTLTVLHLAAATEVNAMGAMSFIGTHAGNVVNAFAGRIAIGLLGASTVSLLRVGSASGSPDGVQVFVDAQTTLGTATIRDGLLITSAPITTLVQTGGQWRHTAGAVATASVWGGSALYLSGHTVTTLHVGKSGTFDCSRVTRARTVTSGNVYAGGTILDPQGSITWTNPLALVGCDLTSAVVNLGSGRTYAVA